MRKGTVLRAFLAGMLVGFLIAAVAPPKRRGRITQSAGENGETPTGDAQRK